MDTRTLTVHCSGPDPVVWSPGDGPTSLSTAGEVHLWFATLDQLRPNASAFEASLDPVEIERADRFRFPTDRERFVLGHGLLRSLIGRYLDRDGSLVRYARGPFGKPFLEGKDLRFSFSDTKDAVLVAFAHGAEIGADIETMERTVDHDGVSEHYFTTEETADIASAEDGKRRFLELWTRKEAVLKASGVGIMDDLHVLRVNGAKQEMAITHEAFIAHAAAEYHVHTWAVDKGHIASLAAGQLVPNVLFATTSSPK